jgi:ABC-type sugar transport system permease subunit
MASIWSQLRKNAWAYLFILPMFVLFLGFTLYPMLASVRYTLYKWDGIGLPVDFVGFQNYLDIARDQFFWNAFGNTFLYTIAVVPVQLLIALALSVVLNQQWLKAKRIFRFVFISPIVTSAAIIGILFTILTNTAGQDLNELLVGAGILDQSVDWLGNPGTALGLIIMVGIWIGLGYPLIIFIAALQSIDRDLYDAARVDGADSFTTFWRITVPLIRPVILIVFLITTLHSLRVFDIVQVMTRGGPYFATDVVGTYIYRQAFFINATGDSASRLGYASAAAFFMGVLVMGITIIQYFVVQRAIRQREMRRRV